MLLYTHVTIIRYTQCLCVCIVADLFPFLFFHFWGGVLNRLPLGNLVVLDPSFTPDSVLS